QHQAEVMVIHVVLKDCRAELPHLCLADAERIVHEAKPKLAVLTHYGMTVWRAHPWELAEEMTQRTGLQVKAARDGMLLELERRARARPGPGRPPKDRPPPLPAASARGPPAVGG